jgi:hypothetical protein
VSSRQPEQGRADRVAAVVTVWSKHDHAHALLPVDHELVDATASLRALIAELLLTRAPNRDLFTACAMLGRLLAQRGGSPTLATSTMEGARRGLEEGEPSWLMPASAALAEGFAAARLDAATREAAAGWEYPRCAVPLGDGTVAIAAGFPGDDGEAVAAWAARVAHGAALGGARRAQVAGVEPARTALLDALSLVGIEVRSGGEGEDEGDRPLGWLPWRRVKR